MRAHDLVPKGDLDAVDPRETFGEEADVPADALRHDIEVPTRFDCRRIDVVPQIGERLIEVLKPLIHAGGARVQTVEAPIDLVEALIDLVEAPIDLLQTPIDLIEALVDVVQAPVALVQTLVDVLAQGIERPLKLGIHGVILLQSKEGGVATAVRRLLKSNPRASDGCCLDTRSPCSASLPRPAPGCRPLSEQYRFGHTSHRAAAHAM